MNRVIIVGNGFDLAHGLETKYEHFINWYWEDCGNRLLHCHNKTVADELCSFELKDGCGLSCWSTVWGHLYRRNNPFQPWSLNDVVNISKEDNKFCKFSFTSPLFQRICKQMSLGLVDIENEYFHY